MRRGGSPHILVMNSPVRRMRRLRSTDRMRQLVRETNFRVSDLILPLFVSEKIEDSVPVKSMPGVCQHDLESLVRQASAAHEAGLHAVLLFGIPAVKDEKASQAWSSDGIVQRAVRLLKAELPDLMVITDVCLCEFMSHGHCGVVAKRKSGEHVILNDQSVELLTRTALSHAEAGADVVAPSDMMDGRVAAIRSALDYAGFDHVPILSYAAKFCSSFYGPFRDAAESAPKFGDRRTYQMDPANAREALREAELDVAEGADLLMVKPGLAYLDVLWRIRETFGLPTVVYNVSGEYSMVKAAAANGWLNERDVVLEQMTSFKRAGADLIITYWAQQVAQWMQ
jgi:porphobilinogen synthase